MKIKDNKLYVGCYNGSIYIYELNGTELITVLSGAGGSIQSMEILDTQVSGKKFQALKEKSFLCRALY